MNVIIALNPVQNVQSQDIISWINSFSVDRKDTYNILYTHYFFDKGKFLLNAIDQKYIKLLIAKSNCQNCNFTIDELHDKFVKTDDAWLTKQSDFFSTMSKINSKFTFTLNSIGDLVEDPTEIIKKIRKQENSSIDNFINNLKIVTID